MESYLGCRGLLISLTEQAFAIRMRNKCERDNALDFQVGSLFAAFLDFFLLSETFCLILVRRAVEPRLLVSGREGGSKDMLHTEIQHTYSCVFWAWLGTQGEEAPSASTEG